MFNIKWSGLADEKYYEYIAKYCLPSWEKLPGEKFIVHNSDTIDLPFLQIINQADTLNKESKIFLQYKAKKKTLNFWKKMQAQTWAIRNIKDCDFIVLLDTDIEVLDFDEKLFNNEIEKFVESNYVWATGRSHSGHHDSGFIVFNMNHPDLHTLVDEYENIWESGQIYKLRKSYDGNAVESMFDKWPSYKIMNYDYGSGFHVYDLGFVHYGSKMPKSLRSKFVGPGIDLVNEHTSKIKLKTYR